MRMPTGTAVVRKLFSLSLFEVVSSLSAAAAAAAASCFLVNVHGVFKIPALRSGVVTFVIAKGVPVLKYCVFC